MPQTMFIGSFGHTIDNKGRVIIPTAYRDQLGTNFMIGLNNNATALAIYPSEKWDRICNDLGRIPMEDEIAFAYVRYITSNTFLAEADSQGRVMLPNVLKDAIGLIDKAIRFVGMRDYIEIWDDAQYSSQNNATATSMKDMLKHINQRYN